MVELKDVMAMSETELSRRGSVSKHLLVQALLESRKQFEKLNKSNVSNQTSEANIVSQIDDILAKRLNPLRESLFCLSEKFENLEKQFCELKKDYDCLSQKYKYAAASSETVHEEAFQRFVKRDYLIVSGLPEQTSGSVDERREADEEAIESVGRAVGISKVDPEEIRRIGKMQPGRPRLLRFKCSNGDIRSTLLRTSKDLKKHHQYTNVFINRDLTRQQREQSKHLRLELKRRRDAGEDVVIFRGMVQPKDKNQTFFH